MSKNKKPGFITSIRTGRGITGTTIQRYKINGGPDTILVCGGKDLQLN